MGSPVKGSLTFQRLCRVKCLDKTRSSGCSYKLFPMRVFCNATCKAVEINQYLLHSAPRSPLYEHHLPGLCKYDKKFHFSCKPGTRKAAARNHGKSVKFYPPQNSVSRLTSRQQSLHKSYWWPCAFPSSKGFLLFSNLKATEKTSILSPALFPSQMKS